MKINPQINFWVRNGVQIPIYRVDEQRDVHFVPLFVDQGQDISNRLSFNKILFEKVFTSEKTMILRPIDWEDEMTAFDLENDQEITDLTSVSEQKAKKLVFRRNYKIGTYFVGKVLNFTMKTAFKLGRFARQKINSDITVYFANSQIWDADNQKIKKAYLYCFYSCPQLSPNDILYVSSVVVYLDHFSRYLCHLITFSSLDDTFKKYGRNVDTQIQFSAPGSVPILPKVAPILNFNEEVPVNLRPKNILFYQPDKMMEWIEGGVKKTAKLYFVQKNTKRLYIDDFYFLNTKPITNFQLEINGFAGLISIEFWGRKIYKRSTTEGLVIGRSQRLFTHQNLPFQPTPLSISKTHENDWIIIPNMRANARFWNDYRKEKGLDYSPDAKRNQQLILESNGKKIGDFQNQEWDIVKNEKVDIKQNLVNKNALIYDLRHNFVPSENKIIDVANKKLVINENDFLSTKKMTFTQFININADLMARISRLELGIYLLTNHKKFATDLIGDSLGLLGAIVGKFTRFFSKNPAPILTGFGAMKYLATLGGKYVPDTIFYSKNVLKLSSAINIAFPRLAIDYLSQNLPAHANFYIPLEFVMGSWSNTFSQFFGGENARIALNFELTEKFKNGDEIIDSSLLETGEKTLPNDVYETTKTNESGFIVEKIIIKATSARDLKLSFWNGNEMQNYFHIHSQAKFSKVLVDLETIIFLGSFNEKLTNEDRFNANIVDSQELQVFSLATYLAKIQNLIDSDTKNAAQNQAKNQVLNDLFFQTSKIFETNLDFLNFEIKNISQSFVFESDFAQKWDLFKALKFTKSDGTQELVFADEIELKTWLLNQFQNQIETTIALIFKIEKVAKFESEKFSGQDRWLVCGSGSRAGVCQIDSTVGYPRYSNRQIINVLAQKTSLLDQKTIIVDSNKFYNQNFALNYNLEFQKEWINYFWNCRNIGYHQNCGWIRGYFGNTNWPLFQINENLNFKLEIDQLKLDFDTADKKIKLSFELKKIEKSALTPLLNDADALKMRAKLTFKAKLNLKTD